MRNVVFIKIILERGRDVEWVEFNSKIRRLVFWGLELGETGGDWMRVESGKYLV